MIPVLKYSGTNQEHMASYYNQDLSHILPGEPDDSLNFDSSEKDSSTSDSPPKDLIHYSFTDDLTDQASGPASVTSSSDDETFYHQPKNEIEFIKPSSFLLSYVKKIRNKPPCSPVSDDSSVILSSPSEVRQPVKPEHVRSSSDGARCVRATHGRGLNFMEDGGQSIVTEADGFTPRPKPGQDLIDFLMDSQFSQCTALLDRENAHFCVAEAVLGAIERMKSRMSMKEKRAKVKALDESDEDRQRVSSKSHPTRKLRKASALHFSASDDPATTDYTPVDSSCSDASDIEQNSSKKDKEEEDVTRTATSAENVAINLLMNYNSEWLPKASELQWLVSEKDVPQKLLPIPSGVNSEESEAASWYSEPAIRGTNDWAPPRPQLILTIQKSGKRSAHLAAQNWRCSGCGLKVSEHFSRCFRFCNYLGRYFCTSCHTNQKAIIPAKVIHKWRFKPLLVSNFSDQLLRCMENDPLFNITSLNPSLYSRSRNLHQTHVYRVQLKHARTYIITCSRASKERCELERLPEHWSTQPHVYSIHDLCAAESGQLNVQIKKLTSDLVGHISSCEVCLGQGFICELCGKGGPIFPFQLDAVRQCTKCKSCYHFLCFTPDTTCSRCVRLENRSRMQD